MSENTIEKNDSKIPGMKKTSRNKGRNWFNYFKGVNLLANTPFAESENLEKSEPISIVRELNTGENVKNTKGIDIMGMQKYIDRLDQDRRDMENRLREDRCALEERLIENDKSIEQRLFENLQQTEQRISDSHQRIEEYVRRCIAEHKEERRAAEEQLNDKLKEAVEKMDKVLESSESAKKLTIGVCVVTMLGIAAVVAAIIMMPMWLI